MILQIAINSKLRLCLDYLPPPDTSLDAFKPGVRVRVPFRNKTTIGVLIHVAKKSTLPPEKLKQAIEILDTKPIFSPHIFELLRFASDYYQHPIGEVFLTALPTLLRKGRLLPESIDNAALTDSVIQNHERLVLNAEQEHAVEQVSQTMHQFGVYLLNGVTGSGKTEVYWRLIEKNLQNNKQVLILVPEIGLTPQLCEQFQQKLNVPIVVMHSTLTEKKRLNGWLDAQRGSPVVIGTRSAVFTPLPNLGLIIVDEEHDLSFKQQEGFRYSARDIAVVRAHKENIPILLGSATPSLESLLNVQKKRYVQLDLSQRAGSAVMPHFHIVDIRSKELKHGLSSALLEAIERHLSLGQQVLLFINRRGYAPVLLCHACGWIAACKRCDARLTLHQSDGVLTCHHCGFCKKIDVTCPTCKAEELLRVGLGTQRIETILTKHFPNTPISRIDRDTTRRKGSMVEALSQAKEGHSQILIGTQMIAKGHHLPKVTLVGILDMDGGFFSGDFRATERMAQLLVQVAGRAGREQVRGEVYLQTHQPEHPLLLTLLREGYQAFTRVLLAERKLAELPPFSYLALFRAESVKEQEPLDFLKQVSMKAKKLMGLQVGILGPIASPMEKKAGRYRAQLLFRASQRSVLNKGIGQLLTELSGLKTTQRVRWSIDIDPLDMF